MPSINDALDQQYSLFITCTPEIKVTHCKYTSIYAQPKLSFKYTKKFLWLRKKIASAASGRETPHSEQSAVLCTSEFSASALSARGTAGGRVRGEAEG